MFFRSLRRTFLAAWLRLFAGGISLFALPVEGIGPSGSRLLLPGLLLAGHRLLLALAGARVGLGALPVHRKPATVADPLVAADLDLPPDVGCFQRLQRPGAADAIDIGERDLVPLIAG